MNLRRRILIGASIAALVLLMIAAPFIADLVTCRRAASLAITDWNNRESVIYGSDSYNNGGLKFKYEFDRQSGLRFRNSSVSQVFANAYNRQVQRLLADNGIPSWSMKTLLVSEKDLAIVLNANTLSQVVSFPYDVNQAITVFRKGRVTRRGITGESLSDGLHVLAGHSLIGVDESKEIYVGTLPFYPNVVFVRSGTIWLGVFSDGGELLCSCSRF